MKQMTIGKRTVLGFASLGVLCAAISWFAVHQLRTAQELSTSVVKNAMPSMAYAFRAKFGQAEAQILLHKLVRAEKPEERKKIREELVVIGADITEILKSYEGLITHEADRATFEEFKKQRTNFVAEREKFFGAVETNREAALALLEGPVAAAYTSYLKAGETLVTDNSKEANDQGQTLEKGVARSVVMILIAAAIGLVAGAIAAFVIIRGITTALKRVSNALEEGALQVASAAGQVAGSSQTLAEGASEQAASLEETSSSLEEMASMTKRNAEGAEQANNLARQARAAADTGAADVQLMNNSMQAIKASSDEIAKIIKTIDEIAFQTNILALNAAVEAARAGEAGMGFAVVADEVRNLAQRCAQSAKETALKIDDSVNKTAQGVEISRRVGEGLQTIVNQVRQVDELIAQVTAASKEQSQGIIQLNTAVTQMDQVTQSNAASAEESAAAAEEMNAQADALRNAVAELLQLAGGQQKAAEPVAATPEKFAAHSKSKARAATKPAHTNGSSTLKQAMPDPMAALKPKAGRQTAPEAVTDGFRDF